MLKKFETQVLPKLDALKEKVEAGGLIDGYESEFLQKLLARLAQAKTGVALQPDWQPFYGRLVNLCHEIIAKGLGNQDASSAE